MEGADMVAVWNRERKGKPGVDPETYSQLSEFLTSVTAYLCAEIPHYCKTDRFTRHNV